VRIIIDERRVAFVMKWCRAVLKALWDWYWFVNVKGRGVPVLN
jgi:hypothetical protein